jgi:hypothetical protein
MLSSVNKKLAQRAPKLIFILKFPRKFLDNRSVHDCSLKKLRGLSKMVKKSVLDNGYGSYFSGVGSRGISLPGPTLIYSTRLIRLRKLLEIPNG